MTGQCAVITLIFVLMTISFFRARRTKWAWLTIPLAVLPFSAAAAAQIAVFFTGRKLELMPACCVILAAVIVSCIWTGVCSTKMLKRRRVQISYIAISAVFNIVLGIILINHYIVFQGQ